MSTAAFASAQEYLSSLHPELAVLSSDHRTVSAAVIKRGSTPVEIFVNFFAGFSQGTPAEFSIDDIIAYMAYRVTGRDPNDRFSGSIMLDTFLGPELYTLTRMLPERFNKLQWPWSLRTITADVKFGNACDNIEKKMGEFGIPIHARPIWPSDEQRLIQATSNCTGGYHDRALLRALLVSGARVCDISEVTVALNIREDIQYDGQPAFVLTVPNMKTKCGTYSEFWMTGVYHTDMQNWLERRKFAFPENFSPYLFFTTSGRQLTSPAVCMMLDTLSCLAGYGPRFFTAHSARMGFASRRAARVFSVGGSGFQAYEDLASTGAWNHRSSSVSRYVDTNVRRFFQNDNPLSWSEFSNLDPEVLHCLEELRPVERRSSTWFYHNRGLLLDIADGFGIVDITDNTTQYQIRKLIGRALFRSDTTGFAAWLRENSPALKPNRDNAGAVVALLLENGFMRRGFEWSSLTDEQLHIIYMELRYATGAVVKNRQTVRTRAVRALRLHRLDSLEHGFYTRRRLQKFHMDRHVNVGRLPNGRDVLLTSRRVDMDIPLVRKLPKLEDLGYIEPPEPSIPLLNTAFDEQYREETNARADIEQVDSILAEQHSNSNRRQRLDAEAIASGIRTFNPSIHSSNLSLDDVANTNVPSTSTPERPVRRRLDFAETSTGLRTYNATPTNSLQTPSTSDSREVSPEMRKKFSTLI